MIAETFTICSVEDENHGVNDMEVMHILVTNDPRRLINVASIPKREYRLHST